MPIGALATSRGLIVTDVDFRPLYGDQAALKILAYPEPALDPVAVQRRIRAILGVERHAPAAARAHTFQSGRRTYACRAMIIEPLRATLHRPMIALLLERIHRQPAAHLLAAGALFQLSPRQREAVWGVMQGLTTKEIAARMRVSPHTVKQFIRQAMGKIGVTTRAGIVGRVIAADVGASRRMTGPIGTA